MTIEGYVPKKQNIKKRIRPTLINQATHSNLVTKKDMSTQTLPLQDLDQGDFGMTKYAIVCFGIALYFMLYPVW